MRQITYLILLLLIGCTSTSQHDPIQLKEQPTVKVKNRGIDQLLLEAEQTFPPYSTKLKLEAAEIAKRSEDYDLANRIVRAIESPYLNNENIIAYSMIYAELALELRNPTLAIQLLEDRRFQKIRLNPENQIKAGILRAKAYRIGRSYLASARELIYIDRLIPTEQQLPNHEEIFSTLLQLPEETLEEQAKQTITSEIRGWLSLAAMTKRFQYDPIKQLKALKDWQKVWSSHPATLAVPRSLETLSQIVKDQPENIALILPLRGELGKLGRAIRNGYIAAHYTLTSDTHLRIYDTTTADVLELINQAHQDGAELIIGPLDRDRVTRAALNPLPVSVIALNRARDGEINPNLYQFGLAPEDESSQVAAQIILEGKINGVVIAPDTDWGKRNFNAFSERFESAGGVIIDRVLFEKQRDYSDVVKSLLNVDSSEARAADLRRTTGERFEFQARRRQDIDFVFMLANSVQARGINPTLAFFYAEDIPVYATSHVHIPANSRIDAIDMNGIRFCDMPWKLTSDDPIQIMTTKIWPQAAHQLAPFYALGVDAHRLFPRLEQLKKDKRQRIFGSTGVLSLNKQNVVLRSLMWAQFQEGEVNSVPIVFNEKG